MTASSRVFVVGNGPSLLETDLDLLVGEDSYACNSINRIYPTTPWRPTDIFWGDPVRAETSPDMDAHFLEDYRMHLSAVAASRLPHIPRSISTYDLCTTHRNKPKMLPDTWGRHDNVYCRFGGTLHVALQHAVESYQEIYLVGVDLGVGPTSGNFHADYPTQVDSQEKADSVNLHWRMAHNLANEYVKKNGVQIINATIDVLPYKRVDFASLFNR